MAEQATKRARIIVITGNGKGKTTSGLGTLLRAWGHGQKVAFLQFVKAREDTGEFQALRKMDGVDVFVMGAGFLWTGKPEDHYRAAAEAFQKAQELIHSGKYDVVVLDEVVFAAHKGLVDESELVTLLKSAPATMTIVLTGRHASEALMEVADTVSVIEPAKHAFEQGIAAMKGVEW